MNSAMNPSMTITAPAARRPVRLRRRSAGFSVVELMVSVVVGLLALMFATKLIVNAEQNKSVSLGGSDAMQNGMLALFTLSGDAGQSGWGLNDDRVNGCNTLMSDANGYTLLNSNVGGVAATPLAPVVIQSNGTGSDQISFNFGGDSNAAASVSLAPTYTAGDASMTVDSSPPYGYGQNDVLLVAHDPSIAGGNCTLAEVAATPTGKTITLGGRYGAAAGATEVFLANQSRAFNLGPEKYLAFHTWSVSNGVLMLRATNLAGASASAVSVVDNIVAIKAQYGFDTTVVPSLQTYSADKGMLVGQWSGPMIDADGDGVVGGPGDFQRIAAVRVAVIARSKNPEKPNSATGLCTATTVLPVVFNSASPNSTPGSPMTVNVTVTGDAIDWKCYRYRVFETIVPMRNLEWRP